MSDDVIDGVRRQALTDCDDTSAVGQQTKIICTIHSQEYPNAKTKRIDVQFNSPRP